MLWFTEYFFYKRAHGIIGIPQNDGLVQYCSNSSALAME